MYGGNRPAGGNSGPSLNSAEIFVEFFRIRGGWGAIAFSSATGAWGYSFNASDQADAEALALQHCPAGSIVVWGHRIHLALALPNQHQPGTLWRCGWAWDAKPRRAQAKALAACAGEPRHVALLLNTIQGALAPFPVKPPPDPARERRLRPRRQVRAAVFAFIALIFLTGAAYDLATSSISVTLVSFLLGVLFAWACLDQVAKAFRKLPAASTLPPLSPDGHYQWDGVAWRPRQQ